MMTRNYTRAKAHFFKNLDMGHLCQPEDPYTSNTFTGTKVVGTIGPATQSVDNLAELLEAGMAGARIDLTWGPVDFHRKSLSNLKVRHAFLATFPRKQTTLTVCIYRRKQIMMLKHSCALRPSSCLQHAMRCGRCEHVNAVPCLCKRSTHLPRRPPCSLQSASAAPQLTPWGVRS